MRYELNKISIIFLLIVLQITIFVFPINAAKPTNNLRIASVFEPVETGIIYVLNIPFENRWGIYTDVKKMNLNEIYKALRKGEIDFIIANCKEFIDNLEAENLISSKRSFMSNNIHIFGPINDPCGLNKLESTLQCLKKIKECNWLYYYSELDSGLDREEIRIWKPIGGIPIYANFIKTRLTTNEKLNQSDKDKTYCLIDSGTYFSNSNILSGRLFCKEDKSIKNEYYACVVSEIKGKSKNYVSASAYSGWLTSLDAQKMIGDFKKNGEIIFSPLIILSEKENKQIKPFNEQLLRERR